jgi:tmRNA-binding protein
LGNIFKYFGFRPIYLNKFNITIYFIQKQIFMDELPGKKLARGREEVENIYGKNHEQGWKIFRANCPAPPK